MLALCTRCWAEMRSDELVCAQCGRKAEQDLILYKKKLFAALHRVTPETRTRICWVLGLLGDSSAVPHLLELLEDNDAFVRVAALRALGQIGDESALPALQKAAKNESLLMRMVARQALEMIGVREGEYGSRNVEHKECPDTAKRNENRR